MLERAAFIGSGGVEFLQQALRPIAWVEEVPIAKAIDRVRK
jgi:hypothetical protein